MSGRIVRFAHFSSQPLALAWKNDGTRLVISCTDGHVRVVDAETLEVVRNEPAVEG